MSSDGKKRQASIAYLLLLGIFAVSKRVFYFSPSIIAWASTNCSLRAPSSSGTCEAEAQATPRLKMMTDV